MSSTTEELRESGHEARKVPGPPPTLPDPEPPTSPDYFKRRHAVARGDGAVQPIRFSLEVDLNVEQSTWVHEEAKRTGLDYDDIVRALIDRERTSRD